MTAALHVESVGEGAPIVLLHGWGMHAGLWGGLPARLARAHRVHALDLPGHGHSAAHPLPSLDGIVDLLAGRFSDGAVTVLGWSLGAIIAMQWAFTAPQQVRRVILTGATPRFVRDATWPHGMDEAALSRFGDELRASYRLTLQRFVSLQLSGTDEGRDTLVRVRQLLFARGTPSAAALERGLELLRGTDLRANAKDIRQPALLIAGDRDTLTPASASEWLVHQMPRAKLVVITGAAHVPFLSHGERFAAEVEAFLDES